MNSFKKAAIESVDSMAELYKDIANEIWDNPELSLKEYNAAGIYCKVLRERTALPLPKKALRNRHRLLRLFRLLQEAKAEFEKRSAGGYVCPIEAGAKPIAL